MCEYRPCPVLRQPCSSSPRERSTHPTLARARVFRPAHLTAETIAEALKASSGVVAEAARRLRISRDTLHQRLLVDPVVQAARNEAREAFLDLGESELAKLVKAGVPSAVFFLLRTLGARRGWREGVVVEQGRHRVGGST